MDYISPKPAALRLTYSPQIKTLVECLLNSMTPDNFSLEGLIPYGLTPAHERKVNLFLHKYYVSESIQLTCRTLQQGGNTLTVRVLQILVSTRNKSCGYCAAFYMVTFVQYYDMFPTNTSHYDKQN